MLEKTKAYWPLILLLAVIKFVLPIFFQHPMYELQRDEYLYYQQGLHFDIGYLENPPLLAWLGMVSSWFGGTVASIKFWPCLFGAATVVLTCLIAAELGGKRSAQFIAGLSIITGAFIRMHYLFQPNFLDIFFWTLAVYFLVRYINSKEQKFIYWLAISLALGWWGKYSILFMIIATMIGLLFSPNRKIFFLKKTWIAAAIAFLIILPNILWQYFHNWPLLHHMEELQDTQLKYINKKDFLAEQVMMLLPVAIVWITGLCWVLRKKEWRILGIIYITVIALLLFGSGKAYYAVGVYPMLLAAGAVAIERFSDKRTWIRYVLPIAIIVFTYITMPLLLPSRTPEKLAAYYKKIGIKHKWEDLQNHPLPQDFADMLGWKELTVKTEKFYTQLPDSIKTNSTIFCSNYGQAGALKYYGKENEFKNKIISTNGSFALWIPGRAAKNNLLFIADREPDNKNPIFSHFEKSRVVDSVTNIYSRQYGNKIIYLENIDTVGLKMITDKLRESKQQFTR